MSNPVICKFICIKLHSFECNVYVCNIYSRGTNNDAICLPCPYLIAIDCSCSLILSIVTIF
jgi:hypothetical protein